MGGSGGASAGAGRSAGWGAQARLTRCSRSRACPAQGCALLSTPPYSAPNERWCGSSLQQQAELLCDNNEEDARQRPLEALEGVARHAAGPEVKDLLIAVSHAVPPCICRTSRRTSSPSHHTRFQARNTPAKP